MSQKRSDLASAIGPGTVLRWSVATLPEPTTEQVVEALRAIQKNQLPVVTMERGSERLEASVTRGDAYVMSWSDGESPPAVSMDWTISADAVTNAFTKFCRGDDYDQLEIEWRESCWPDLSEKDLEPLRIAAERHANELASEDDGSTEGQQWFVRRSFARELTRRGMKRVLSTIQGGPLPSDIVAYEVELLFLRFLEEAMRSDRQQTAE